MKGSYSKAVKKSSQRTMLYTPKVKFTKNDHRRSPSESLLRSPAVKTINSK